VSTGDINLKTLPGNESSIVIIIAIVIIIGNPISKRKSCQCFNL